MASTDAYHYELPPHRIAQEPAEPRTAARLLVALDDEVHHRRVADLPELLEPGDVLVLNHSRVLPARLRLRKSTGGAVEVLLLEQVDQTGRWEAMVRPGRRVAAGTTLYLDERPVAEVGERLAGGRRVVQLHEPAEGLGEVPLPPYITAPLADPERYQTVYAEVPGSVAAPTAGLHLTTELLDRCHQRGVEVVTVDLAVGLDTFRPIVAERLEDHFMHSERYSVPDSTWDACQRARRVVAVGTTTLRALEAAAHGPREGRTDLFVRPGYRFRVVDVLLTNFHLPRSTLLVLLAAFAGERWRELYECALREGYRFLSFGDAMLVDRMGPEAA